MIIRFQPESGVLSSSP